MITPNGKELQIKPAEGYGSMLSISFTSGGELPRELAGLFTSYRDANEAVANYLNKKVPKKRNAKS